MERVAHMTTTRAAKAATGERGQDRAAGGAGAERDN